MKNFDSEKKDNIHRLMSCKMGFKILISGMFHEKDLVIIHINKEKKYPKKIKSFIDKICKEKIASDETKNDSKLFRVDSYKLKNKKLFLVLENTSYKCFIGTGNKEFVSKFGLKNIANPLSVGAVVVTSDNKLIIGKRLNNLYFNPGKYSIFGGTMDRKKDFFDGSPNPFKAILREIHEEIGIREIPIKTITCLGLVYNLDYYQTYMPFFIETNISCGKLKKYLTFPTQEFEDFIYIEFDKGSIANFLIKNYDKLSQTCLANILLLGKYKFGNGWYISILKKIGY